MEEGHEVTEISTLSTTLDVHAMPSSIRSITSCTLKKGASNLLHVFSRLHGKCPSKNIQNYCFMQSTLIDAVKIRAPFSGTLSLSTEQNKTCYDFSLHNLHAVSDKNTWDTFTQRCFFTSGPCPCSPNVDYMCIAVNSPNLAHQHWEGKKTAKCPNNFDWECGWKLKQIIRVKTDNLI